LVRLSIRLGDPAADLCILAEGNASAEDGDTFWVKASGFNLAALNQKGLVRVHTHRILQYLDGPDLADGEVKHVLGECRFDPQCGMMPSVETFMHAHLLTLPDVMYVGHTHPAPLISLLSIEGAEQIAGQRLYPDEVVCCGPASAWVPYTDPGLPLAKAIRKSIVSYVRKWASSPKTIWLQNHGLITLGRTPDEVESATMMAVKAARVWLGALSTGREIHTLNEEQVSRIHTRPDEHYRQRLLWQLEGRA
jgi:L-ribulose-5-phosphate 4-epimerase